MTLPYDKGANVHGGGAFQTATPRTRVRTLVLLLGHLYPCFGLLMMSALGFKVRVDPLLALQQWELNPLSILRRGSCTAEVEFECTT